MGKGDDDEFVSSRSSVVAAMVKNEYEHPKSNERRIFRAFFVDSSIIFKNVDSSNSCGSFTPVKSAPLSWVHRSFFPVRSACLPLFPSDSIHSLWSLRIFPNGSSSSAIVFIPINILFYLPLKEYSNN